MKTPQFKPKKMTSGKSTFWRIYVPDYLHPRGKRGYCYFSTKADAELARADFLAATRSRSELRILTPAQQRDALRALELLEEQGLAASLVEAVELAIPALRSSGRNVSVAELFDEFAQVKAASWSAASVRNFASAGKLFVEAFGSLPIASMTAKDISLWLAEHFDSEGYRSNVLRTIRPAFSYAVRQEMLPASPFDKMERVKVTAKEIDVFSVEEARALMAAAPSQAKAAFAILLFAGVRPAELTRLKWGDVRDGYIHISAAIAKTAQARNVEIEPCLLPWLELWRLSDEMAIIPKNWKRVNQATRNAAGLSGRQDTARHSYASYHLASYQNIDALKANLGHSRNSDMLFVHYRAAVTKMDAARYWAILGECGG